MPSSTELSFGYCLWGIKVSVAGGAESLPLPKWVYPSSPAEGTGNVRFLALLILA